MDRLGALLPLDSVLFEVTGLGWTDEIGRVGFRFHGGQATNGLACSKRNCASICLQRSCSCSPLPMLLVVPVSLSDQKNLPGVEKAFEVFSPGSGHKLLVIGSPNVTVAVRETAQKLSKHFAGSATSYIFDLDCELGWPSACNYYFQQAAWYVGSSYDEPWLWFEPRHHSHPSRVAR